VRYYLKSVAVLLIPFPLSGCAWLGKVPVVFGEPDEKPENVKGCALSLFDPF
jgi:hypothetical protein